MKWVGYAVYAIYVLFSLWLLVSALAQLHLLWHANRHRKKIRRQLPSSLPFVSIQVPVYNEKFVIEDLLKSLAGLSYPQSCFEIQVLDDSTDETSAIIDRELKALRTAGVNAGLIRRRQRTGFKAGALQHGLPHCRGELIAIFDADFRPPANFLTAMVPHFSEPDIGLVQARWGHLNREQNFLTRIQTYLLDMHFGVEQAGRYNAGYFINFCGTAGIWRKRCIEEAGGWDGTVLSEDLDLSYRAQLAGWRTVYDKEVVVPAQLPSAVDAFRVQQFRWTKGIAQIARKTLAAVCERPLPVWKKLHSVFHLMGSFTFVCLFVNALLTVPLLQLRHQYPEFITLTNYAAAGALNLCVLCFLYYKSADRELKKGWRFLLTYPVFVVVYLALSVQNAVAVLQGWAGVHSPFVRTPKSAGASGRQTYRASNKAWIVYVEWGLLLYFLYGIGLSIYLADYFMLLFFLMMCTGLCILLYPTITVPVGRSRWGLQWR